MAIGNIHLARNLHSHYENLDQDAKQFEIAFDAGADAPRLVLCFLPHSTRSFHSGCLVKSGSVAEASADTMVILVNLALRSTGAISFSALLLPTDKVVPKEIVSTVRATHFEMAIQKATQVGIEQNSSVCQPVTLGIQIKRGKSMEKKTTRKVNMAAAVLAVVCLALVSATGWSFGHSAKKSKTKQKIVYVCACMGTSSCSCLTESKSEGPCACGTHGGPPMKAVPADGNWAKYNRDQMAK